MLVSCSVGQSLPDQHKIRQLISSHKVVTKLQSYKVTKYFCAISKCVLSDRLTYITAHRLIGNEFFLHFDFEPCTFPLKAQRNVTYKDPANGFYK